MKWSWTTHAMHPRSVFRISRAARREVRNVFVRVEHEGVTGLGEASANEFYGESADGVVERLEAARPWLTGVVVRTVPEIEAAWSEGWRWLAPSRAAQCAVDLALWDWCARRFNRSVAELAWGAPAEAVRTFCTIGLSEPEVLEAKLQELAGFPGVKLKADANADLDAVRRVREAGHELVAIDANCAWREGQIAKLAELLSSLGVAFVEQPVPPGDEPLLPRRRAIPLLADESCVLEGDVPRVAEHYDGFNIKLVKCGGITPARRMVEAGRALGRRIMVGCMLESSVLIAAGAAVAQRTDYADLDGAWLLADDPARGWAFDRGWLRPPSGPGLGVSLDLTF